jgi:hypothetical protein
MHVAWTLDTSEKGLVPSTSVRTFGERLSTAVTVRSPLDEAVRIELLHLDKSLQKVMNKVSRFSVCVVEEISGSRASQSQTGYLQEASL